MGPSLTDLDKLLAMPYGCGEQNMVKFAPNIYIMQYLKSTNQLTKEIEDKAKEYLVSGEFYDVFSWVFLEFIGVIYYCLSYFHLYMFTVYEIFSFFLYMCKGVDCPFMITWVVCFTI